MVPFVSEFSVLPKKGMKTEEFETPRKVLERLAKLKSSWHGAGRTPAMISISQIEKA